MINAPKFRSLAAAPLDVSDDDLIRVSDDLGIPVMNKPLSKALETPAPPIDGKAQKTSVEKVSEPAAIPPAPARKKRTGGPKIGPNVDVLMADNRRVALDIPVYLAEQLRARAFAERSTARYFIVAGLKAIGFDVRDEDLIPDARLAQNRK